MSSLPASYHRSTAVGTTESQNNDEKKRWRLRKFVRALKSCFGQGFETAAPPRYEYQRTGSPATGFKGQEVYGTQAEYLDENDIAWGKPKKSKKQARRH